MTILAILSIGVILLYVICGGIYLGACTLYGIGGLAKQSIEKRHKGEPIETKRLIWNKFELMHQELHNHNRGFRAHLITSNGLNKLNLEMDGLGENRKLYCYDDVPILRFDMNDYMKIDGVYFDRFKHEKNLPDIPMRTKNTVINENNIENFNNWGIEDLEVKYDNAIKQALCLKFEDAKKNNPSITYNEWETLYYLNIYNLIVEAVGLNLSVGWKWHFDYRTYPNQRVEKYPWITEREYAQRHLYWLIEKYGQDTFEFYNLLPDNTDVKKLKHVYHTVNKRMMEQAGDFVK